MVDLSSKSKYKASTALAMTKLVPCSCSRFACDKYVVRSIQTQDRMGEIMQLGLFASNESASGATTLAVADEETKQSEWKSLPDRVVHHLLELGCCSSYLQSLQGLGFRF